VQQFTRRQKYFRLIGGTLAQKYKALRAGECGGIQFPFVGLCGHWGYAPPTAAMNRSAVVGKKIDSNDHLALHAIA